MVVGWKWRAFGRLGDRGILNGIHGGITVCIYTATAFGKYHDRNPLQHR